VVVAAAAADAPLARRAALSPVWLLLALACLLLAVLGGAAWLQTPEVTPAPPTPGRRGRKGAKGAKVAGGDKASLTPEARRRSWHSSKWHEPEKA